ncbi:WhiB family transcriptional regulator [Streptomyces sp. NBC_00474]|uniref:WhiB family transcriptional regulator n=1 Tax=Streptomyces sp. NBC_00474 TaxID=2975754 RepID=UPI00225864AF|nr:WhiB family transcriptional regulator [Streptomyces sp. NBC_00474]MCX5055077.1 WhiB family transcriptional regulator [Streptomyces sp. NBC_00474]
METTVQSIPFPTPATPTECRRSPRTFDVARGEATDPVAADRIRAAKAACRRCPIAESCLRWALANPDQTPTNVWAATTAGERTLLRSRLARRLGPDWIDALARPAN